LGSEGLHEDAGRLRPTTIDRHRAIVSIMEELEAVDWYDQRVDATDDPELAEVLAHNRDEEKEHAAMTIEWLRRNDPVFDRHLRTYLFTTGSITGIEHRAEHGGDGEGDGQADGAAADGAAAAGPGDLGIGALKEGPS
jgi:hypothetical protein